jgi:Dual specificity phosphatase, catalytic domain
MDWIDSNVAVGSLLDAEEVVTLLRKDVDLIIDARLCFTHPPIQPIVENVITSANLLRVLSEQGARTLIHCVWGVDRTPFLAMVYYAHKSGLSYQCAYEYVKSMHSTTVFHWEWVNLLPSQ